MRVPDTATLAGSLEEALRGLARTRGNELALVDPEGGSCTFADILEDCVALHRFAQGAGLKPADRFITVSDFGVAQARVLLAAAVTSCAMPVGRSATEPEYEQLILAGTPRRFALGIPCRRPSSRVRVALAFRASG